MAEEIYNLKFTGEETDEILESAKNVKEANLTTLNDISGFVCIDKNGNAIGMMSKEQVASVVGGLIGEGTRSKSGLSIKRLTPLLMQTQSINKAIRFHPTNQYAMFNFVFTSYIGGRVTSSRLLGNMTGNVYKTILSGTTEGITIYRSKYNTDIVIVPTNSQGAEYRISFDACETETDIEVIDTSSVDLSEYVQL